MIIFILVITIISYFLVKSLNNNEDLLYEKNIQAYKELDKPPSYEDLLKTEEWKKKRQKILYRDNNKCVYCDETHNLQVHHKYYSKYPDGIRVSPWNYPDDALITLCDECHKKVHSMKKIKTYYRSYLDNY